jgi:DNA-binding MarR family transcriptional regulator
MVRTIDELEDRDLCVRRPSTSDRRANAIHLTEAGRQLFADARGAAATVGETLLADLAPEERAQLRDLLARVVAPRSR